MAKPTDGRRTRRRPFARMLGAIAACLALNLGASPVHADAQNALPRQGTDQDLERELAERFAPIIMVKQQAEPCDADGEPYGPTSVEIVLDNPQVLLRQVGSGDPVVMRGPSAADLHGLGEGFFLDFPGSALSPGCVYERDFERYASDQPPTVYAHIVQPRDEPDVVYVQYWSYWYFNDWNNKHESDWEGIVLEFEASSLGEALERGPVAVGYAQHEGGERAGWDDDKLERDGDHPVVYSSAGSHASYFGSAVYLGRGPSQGFGCDDTTGPSDRLDPEVIVLPDRVTDPDDPLAWLAFEGRWGERHRGPFNGPTGPASKDRWLEPGPWFDELRTSSVVIPGGDSRAEAVIDVFCWAAETGSGLFITWTVSPLNVLVGVVVIGLIGRALSRRTIWTPVAATPVVRRRRAGQILRAAYSTYIADPAAYLLIGLIFIPASFFTGILTAVVLLMPVVGSLISLLGPATGTNLVFAALAGSVANAAAVVAVSAVVAAYLDQPETGATGAIGAARAAWSRRRELFTAFIRAYAIVFVLFATVLGTPWGVRQLIRYQLIPQAVMLDGRGGRGALSRSTELVRGRWFHTALVAAIAGAATALTATAVGLLLLVVASGVPLWLFAPLVSLVYVLVVPLAALAITMLYGDARAQREQVEPRPAEPDVPAARAE